MEKEKGIGLYDISIPCPEEIRLKKCYSYMPYTHWRIKRILKQEYNAGLAPIGGCRCSRVPDYKHSCRLVGCTTGSAIMEGIKPDTLRRFFAQKGFPQYDGESQGQDRGQP